MQNSKYSILNVFVNFQRIMLKKCAEFKYKVKINKKLCLQNATF